jgi:hypothetical protein
MTGLMLKPKRRVLPPTYEVAAIRYKPPGTMAPPAKPYTLQDQVRDDWAMLCRTMSANNRRGW